jgi:hypothetical protein
MILSQVVNGVHLWRPRTERGPPVPEEAPRSAEPRRQTLTL